MFPRKLQFWFMAVMLLRVAVAEGGDEEDRARSRGLRWLQDIREAKDAEEAQIIAFRGARDQVMVEQVFEELLAEKNPRVDPVRIALRLEAVKPNLSSKVDHESTVRLLRRLGPRVPEPERDRLLAAIEGRQADQLAPIAVEVYRIVPERARGVLQALLLRTPPDADALAAVIMDPGIASSAVVEHLTHACAQTPGDPLLALAWGLVSGKREEAATRLLDVARQERDRRKAALALEMLGALQVGPDFAPPVLAVAAARPDLAEAAYRACTELEIPSSSEGLLSDWTEGDVPALSQLAARLLYLHDDVRANRFKGLVHLSSSKDAGLREIAAEGLGRYGQRGFACGPALARLVKDDDARVHTMALRWSAAVEPDGALNQSVVSVAESGDRLAAEALRVLAVWHGSRLEAAVRKYIAAGRPSGCVPAIAAQRGWRDIVRICRDRASGSGSERATALLASLCCGDPEGASAESIREWQGLSNGATLEAARRWCEAGGELPEPVVSDIERRLWEWGDSDIGDELWNRLWALWVLSSCGKMADARLGDGLMRLFSVLLEEEDGGAPMPLWLDVARKVVTHPPVERESLPLWYFDRMSRNVGVDWEIRHACRWLVRWGQDPGTWRG